MIQVEDVEIQFPGASCPLIFAKKGTKFPMEQLSLESKTKTFADRFCACTTHVSWRDSLPTHTVSASATGHRLVEIEQSLVYFDFLKLFI
jgi:hypothetical protein